MALSKMPLSVDHIPSDKRHIYDAEPVLSGRDLAIGYEEDHPVRAGIDIDIPRPRRREIRDTPAFGALVAKVRGSFEGV